MKKSVHKQKRNGGVFLLRKRRPRDLLGASVALPGIARKKQSSAKEADVVMKARDSDGSYVSTRAAKLYQGDPFYERVVAQHPNRNKKTLAELQNEKMKAADAGKAPSGYSQEAWRHFQKSELLQQLGYSNQKAAIEDLQMRVGDKNKESMSNLLVNRDQEDQAVADDLLRLEAEAASIKAIMKRRQSELSSHLGYITTRQKQSGLHHKPAHLSNDVKRLESSLATLKREYKKLSHDIVSRAAEIASKHSTVVLQHRSKQAKIKDDETEFEEAIWRLRSKNTADMLHFTRPVRTWTNTEQEERFVPL
mmetsp:Transcript_42824/g.81710  ORF Transcript_42824/g.81710 Transcript_42824/m.81710 type:complete len:307 (-) Transcript_42824:267-1187(-)